MAYRCLHFVNASLNGYNISQFPLLIAGGLKLSTCAHFTFPSKIMILPFVEGLSYNSVKADQSHYSIILLPENSKEYRVIHAP